MKKFLFCLVFVFSMFLITIAHANEAYDSGIYLGVGLSYAIDDFDAGEIAGDYGIIESQFDNAWGLNIGGGYQFTEGFALEGHFSNFSEFEAETVDADVSTFIVQAKFLDRFYGVRPFVTVGLGAMDVDFDLKAPGRGEESEFGPCASVGLGMDVILNENLIIGPKVGYVLGFSDVSSVKYFHFTVGLDLHF